LSKKIVIIGAGLAGTVLANELSKNSHIEITVLEKGGSQAPVLDDELYTLNKPNLKFTRGEGAGGTSNYWHSGLIKMPNDCSWANEILANPGWYQKAIELTGSFFSESIEQGNSRVFDEIYYPNQRFKPSLHNSVSLETSVIDLQINPTNNSVSYSRHGFDRVVNYDALIICAGGIGTPALLKDKYHVGYFSSPLIGKNLTDHVSSIPMRVKMKSLRIMKFSKKWPKGITRKGYVYQDPESGLRHIVYIRPAFSVNLKQHSQKFRKLLVGFWSESNKLLAFIKLASSFDILLEIFANKLPFPIPTRYLALNVVSEQECLNSNSVTYKNDQLQIRWQFSDFERKSVIKACHMFVKHSGLDVDDFSIEAEDKIQFTACCHHSGTAPFGNDPRYSVVDLNLLIHDFDNIYICDGSVLPSTAYANTGLSIIALSLRLADYLGKLRL